MKNKKQKGFTLLEIMVVIVILGVLASMIVPNLMGNKDNADRQKVVTDIVALENALDMYKLDNYRLDNYRYPVSEQGLESLVSKPEGRQLRNYPEDGYIKRLPQDPWGNDYILISPGDHGKIDILSAGQDNEEGTDDDIGNWNLTEDKNDDDY